MMTDCHETENISFFYWNAVCWPRTKRNEEKVVVTKIYFYGSAKIEQKIKVCLMENKGSVAKIDQSEGEQLYANFKTALFVKYLGSC